MPVRLLAFGNNAFGNLAPDGEPLLKVPLDITDSVKCEEIVWSSWSTTIGRTRDGGYRVWGMGELVTSSDRINDLRLDHPVLNFVGFDDPLGYLAQDGICHIFDGKTSSTTWSAVCVDSLAQVFAAKDNAIHRFKTFDDFMVNEGSEEIRHPLLRQSFELYVMESRCFVRVRDSLFELVKNELRQVEDLEGLGISSIAAGRRNRLGVVTPAGDAYIIDTRNAVPDLVELNEAEDVRLLSLGSDMDVVVTESKVLVRGQKTFVYMELELNEEKSETWHEIPGVDASKVIAVTSARWSTIFTMSA